MNSYLIDPYLFCSEQAVFKGELPVAQFERVAAACAKTDGVVSWSVSGNLTALGQPQLTVHAKTRVTLVCQRCLDELVVDLDSQTRVLVAKTEEEADKIEEQLDEDDATEVVVSSAKLDLMVLIEDEILLAMPFSAKHDVCQHDLMEKVQTKKQSPFSVLSELKNVKTTKK